MDKGTLGVLIPIIVMLIPLTAIVFKGLDRLARTRLEEARMRMEGVGSPEIEELRNEVNQLRTEMGEVQERLDFTERLLAQQNQPKIARSEQ